MGGGGLIVLKNVGLLLKFIALVPLLVLPVSLWYREWLAAQVMVLTSGALFLVGWSLAMIPAPREPRLREGLLIAAAGWAIVPIGSVLPLVIVEGWSVVHAVFETTSAWTGTGMTIADVTTLSHTTLMWRSTMQWLGGLGVIVLTLAILARPGTGLQTLYAGEGREDRLRPSVLSTVRTMWWIYLSLTVASITLLLLVGMPAWEALNHAMTGIGTAGMSVLPGGIGEYDASFQLALLPIMIAGALPFVATYALFRGHWRAFTQDVQARALFVLILIAIPLLGWLLTRVPDVGGDSSWVAVVFQSVSAVTSTGFQTIDMTLWSREAKIAVIGLMLLGGAAGSTAGGIKIVRGILLLKGVIWKLERSGLPTFAVTSFRFGGEKLDERQANEAFADAAFIGILWVIVLFLAAITLFTLLPAEVNVVDAFFDVASAQGNSGLSTGVVAPTLSDGALVAFSVLMWAGRLEILPVLLLLRALVPRFSKR